jgi:hypothetical protein
MQEQHGGVTGLPHIQFVFLELPKYAGGNDPQTLVDKWAYFFREAGNLLSIPEALRHPPVLDALEGARTARFSREEWDAYIASMAIRTSGSALAYARRQGQISAKRFSPSRARTSRSRTTIVPASIVRGYSDSRSMDRQCFRCEGRYRCTHLMPPNK